MDQHHVDADPDPTFHFDANPDSYPVPADSLTLAEKSYFFLLIHSSASLHCFIFLVSVIGVIIFNINTANTVVLPLHLVGRIRIRIRQMMAIRPDPDPDP